MARDIIVSHSSGDAIFANHVCSALERHGILCWIAPRDVAPGAPWDEAILDAIDEASAMLLILSAHANASPYVKNEVNHAFSKRKTIFTFRTDDVAPARSLAFYLARHHWLDAFPPPIDEKVNRLVAAIAGFLGKTAVDTPRGSLGAAPYEPSEVPAPADVALGQTVLRAEGRLGRSPSLGGQPMFRYTSDDGKTKLVGHFVVVGQTNGDVSGDFKDESGTTFSIDFARIDSLVFSERKDSSTKCFSKTRIELSLCDGSTLTACVGGSERLQFVTAIMTMSALAYSVTGRFDRIT